MAGLSILLERYKDGHDQDTPQIISRFTMNKPSSPPPRPSTSSFSPRDFSSDIAVSSTNFLDHCFLCQQKLLPGKDIYMYKGDKAFCSEECRCRQIFMDEETVKTAKRYNCSLAARKPRPASSSPSSTTSSSPSSRDRKGSRDRAKGFAF